MRLTRSFPLLAAALLAACAARAPEGPPLRVTLREAPAVAAAVVAAVDPARGEVALREADGEVYAVALRPGAPSLDALRPGDAVLVERGMAATVARVGDRTRPDPAEAPAPGAPVGAAEPLDETAVLVSYAPEAALAVFDVIPEGRREYRVPPEAAPFFAALAPGDWVALGRRERVTIRPAGAAPAAP